MSYIRNRIFLITVLFRCFILSVMVFPFTGCIREDLSGNGGEEDVPMGVLGFELSAGSQANVTTRSVDENAINDIHLLVYDGSHKLLKKEYFPSPTSSPVQLTMLLPAGSGYTVYGIANTGNGSLFSNVSAVDTEDKLKAFSTGALSSWNAIGSGSNLLLSGSVGNVTVSASSSNVSAPASTCSLSLKRLVAKVTLDVSIASGSGITISGYRIYGIPTKSYYIAHPLNTEDSADDTNTSRATDACLPENSDTDWTNSGQIKLSNATSFNTSFYMYENRVGVNTTIAAQKNKMKANVPGTPADSAAYMVIDGMALGYRRLSWKIYLGANNTSNFNMKRNWPYTYTITLKANDSDTRITYKKSKSIWAGSNIYWDGSKLTFDIEETTTNNQKQGVCFQWGSLIGISLSSDYVTYTPTYNSDNPTSSIWSSGSTSWGSFYITDAGSDYGQTNTFLNDAAQNEDADYTAKKGDICQYLSKIGAVSGSWRMPTAREFNPEIYGGGDWSGAGNTIWTPFGSFDSVSGSVDGQSTNISSGGTYTVDGGTSSFPASGYHKIDGTLNYVGVTGYYWSSSASSETKGFRFYFNNDVVYPAFSNSRQFGFVVRCVQN
jgi:hypothetical protein